MNYSQVRVEFFRIHDPWPQQGHLGPAKIARVMSSDGRAK